MKSIADYTEEEFLSFVSGIYHADPHLYPTEKSHVNAVFEFERLTEHPLGADLLTKPTKNGFKDTPQDMVNEVKRWRSEQGLAGFKAS
ncbi:bacteriocin immunity protein [Pseudomonas sp. NPDC089428]|uniref:bacteriocin immunity protein n=1 Tax=unclassified Pseudomonas TaxID=196821 RepID=UPI0031D1890A